MLDVFYISYNEDFADENYEMLQVFAPLAKRIHGVKGIFEAHKKAAEQSNTTHFYVVDADAIIEEEFTFKFTPSKFKEAYQNTPESDCVFTWRSRNPINDLIYGYGAVKLFPKKPFLELTDWSVDMTTSIGCPFVPKFQISNVTAFNTDPFNTWKSAFRECVKLSSNIIDNNDNIDDEYRLKVWCSRGAKRQFGEYALLGAQQGKDFGEEYRDNKDALKKINDFDWLEKKFEEAI